MPSAALALVRLAGRTFIPLGLAAKLPLAMGQLGVLLLVADRTGSYGAGGLAAAAIGIGSAAGAPVTGALADRWGQRGVLAVGAVAYAAGMLAVVVVTRSAASTALLLTVAVAAGLFAPQIGPLARVRWVAIVRRVPAADRSRRLTEAFAVESATDEVSFVAGPALVGVLAAAAGPWLGPVVTAALSLTAALAFALHPTAALVRPHRDARPQAAAEVAGQAGPRPLRRGAIATLLVAGSMLGLVFGGTQVGVTSLSAELGRPGAAGLVYALLGVGSAVAGLASAGLPPTFRLADRLVAFAGALAVLAAPLLLVGSVRWAAAAVLLLGCAVAPYLIVLYALVERAAPFERAATVMTLLSSAVIVGYAAGSTGGGLLADASGHRAAFAVPVAAGCAALVLALVARPLLLRLSATATREP
ncbi:MAG TPA: MFS transporter [Angustibacter sp.]|nr:MFS transporter [Angustibacter sp.]